MGGVPVLIVSSAKRQTKKLIFATNCLDFISGHLFWEFGYILPQQNDIIY